MNTQEQPKRLTNLLQPITKPKPITEPTSPTKTKKTKSASTSHKKLLNPGGVLLSQAAEETYSFLWNEHIFEHLPNFLCGGSGVNKSTFAHFIAAQLSNGLDPQGNPIKGCRKVLYYTKEDPLKIIRNRCINFGAKIGKISIVDIAGHKVGENEFIPVAFDEPHYIETDLEKFRPRLVVFDVFAKFFGNMNVAEAKHVNKVYTMLQNMCIKYNCTMLLIHHSKRNPTSRDECLEGSEAIKRFMRSALYVSRYSARVENEDEKINDTRRVICSLKQSWIREPPPLTFYINSTGTEGSDIDLRMGDILPGNLNTDDVIAFQARAVARNARARLKASGLLDEGEKE